MLRLFATHLATLRDTCCNFARLMLRLFATHFATHVARIWATQTFCMMIEFLSQKVYLGDPFRSQQESRTSGRAVLGANLFESLLGRLDALLLEVLSESLELLVISELLNHKRVTHCANHKFLRRVAHLKKIQKRDGRDGRSSPILGRFGQNINLKTFSLS